MSHAPTASERLSDSFYRYPFFLPDYLRAPDLASAKLGIDMPTQAEREQLIKGLEAKSLEAEMGMTAMSYDDAKTARAMLGGISLHRHFAVATPPGSMFTEQARDACGTIDGALAIAEYMNGESASLLCPMQKC